MVTPRPGPKAQLRKFLTEDDDGMRPWSTGVPEGNCIQLLPSGSKRDIYPPKRYLVLPRQRFRGLKQSPPQDNGTLEVLAPLDPNQPAGGASAPSSMTAGARQVTPVRAYQFLGDQYDKAAVLAKLKERRPRRDFIVPAHARPGTREFKRALYPGRPVPTPPNPTADGAQEGSTASSRPPTRPAALEAPPQASSSPPRATAAPCMPAHEFHQPPSLPPREMRRIHQWMSARAFPLPPTPAGGDTSPSREPTNPPMRYLLQAQDGPPPEQREWLRSREGRVGSAQAGAGGDTELPPDELDAPEEDTAAPVPDGGGLQVHGRNVSDEGKGYRAPHALMPVLDAGKPPPGVLGQRQDGLLVTEPMTVRSDKYKLDRRFRHHQADFSVRVHNYGPHTFEEAKSLNMGLGVTPQDLSVWRFTDPVFLAYGFAPYKAPSTRGSVGRAGLGSAASMRMATAPSSFADPAASAAAAATAAEDAFPPPPPQEEHFRHERISSAHAEPPATEPPVPPEPSEPPLPKPPTDEQAAPAPADRDTAAPEERPGAAPPAAAAPVRHDDWESQLLLGGPPNAGQSAAQQLPPINNPAYGAQYYYDAQGYGLGYAPAVAPYYDGYGYALHSAPPGYPPAHLPPGYHQPHPPPFGQPYYDPSGYTDPSFQYGRPWTDNHHQQQHVMTNPLYPPNTSSPRNVKAGGSGAVWEQRYWNRVWAKIDGRAAARAAEQDVMDLGYRMKVKDVPMRNWVGAW